MSKRSDSTIKAVQTSLPLTLTSGNPTGVGSYPLSYSDDIWNIVTQQDTPYLYGILGSEGSFDQAGINEALAQAANSSNPNTDWDNNVQGSRGYVANRTHWIVPTPTDFSADFTLSLSSGYAKGSPYQYTTYPTGFTALCVDGNDFTIVLGDDTFKGRIVVPNPSITMFYVGNPHIANPDYEDNGLTWCVYCGNPGMSTLDLYFPSDYVGSYETTITLTANEYHVLDTHFIPNTIARVADLPAAQVQSDWDENTPTEADYIKGRTHWVVPGTTLHQSTDGYDDYDAGTYEKSVSGCNLAGLMITLDGTTYGPSTLSGDTAYFNTNPNIWASSTTVYTRVSYTSMTIKTADDYHQLSEKYIPATIMRVADLPSMQAKSDWDENTPTEADYIKNRTHYRTLSSISTEYTNNSASFSSNQLTLTGINLSDDFNDETDTIMLVIDNIEYFVVSTQGTSSGFYWGFNQSASIYIYQPFTEGADSVLYYTDLPKPTSVIVKKLNYTYRRLSKNYLPTDVTYDGDLKTVAFTGDYSDLDTKLQWGSF